MPAGTAQERRGTWLRWALPGALAAGCLALLLSRVGGADWREAAGRVSPADALVGFLLVVASYLLEALRFRVLLGRAAPFGRLFGVTLAQNVIAQVIPARAGDVGYVVMVSRAGMARVGVALMTLLLCRFVDLLLVVVLYFVSLAHLSLSLPVFRQAAWGIGGATAAAVALAGALLLGRRRAVDFFEAILRRTRLLRWRPVRYLWAEMLAALPHVGRFRLVGHLLPMLGLTLLIWTATLAWNGLVWRAVGSPLRPMELVFLFSFTHVVSLLPIIVFAGVGTGDLIHATVLQALGRGTAPAAVFSLCFRVLAVAYVAALSLLAGALIGWRWRAGAREPHDVGDDG